MKYGNGSGYGIGNKNKTEEQLSQRFREKCEENGESSHTGRKVGSAIRSKDRSVSLSESGSTNGEKFFDNQFAREVAESVDDLKWLKPTEAARYLRISMSSLKTLIYRGRLQPGKLGRLNRFLKEDLERLIELPNSNRR